MVISMSLSSGTKSNQQRQSFLCEMALHHNLLLSVSECTLHSLIWRDQWWDGMEQHLQSEQQYPESFEQIYDCWEECFF